MNEPVTQPHIFITRDNNCLLCDRQLSRAWLDAYYGKDPLEGEMCIDCRTKRARSAQASNCASTVTP